MGDFKRLRVWQESHKLALQTYHAAGRIRGSKHLSLRSQLVRAAFSIPANIVEGRAKRSDKEFARFIEYAVGSAAELEYHLILARDARILEQSIAVTLLNQLSRVRKMLYTLRDTLNRGRTP